MHKFPQMMQPAERFPVGSFEWANAMAARLQSANESVDRNTAAGVRYLRQIVLEISDAQAWNVWPIPPAGTPEDFCQIACGRSWEGLIHEIINRTKDKKVRRQLELELRVANAKAQNQNRSQGTRTDLLPGNARKLGGAGQNTVAHILRRLLRERPDLVQRIESGEFSVNAAAILAGFRKQPTSLEQIRRLWQKLSPAERDEVRSWH